MEEVKFSVLMSVYAGERADYLDQSLQSILQQGAQPAEIVLVEDGPLHADLECVIEQYKKLWGNVLKLVPLAQNLGLGAALNEGLKHCSYDLVARMDTDDIAKPERFTKQLAIFRHNPELAICSSWIEEFEGNIENLLAVKKVPQYHDEIVRYARRRCPVNHPAVMYRKQAVLAVGGYEGFPEDYCLWIKMILNGARFYNIQESLLYFRFSRETIKKRGGLKYAISDVRSQIGFYRMGFMRPVDLCYNVIVRSIVRLVPESLRLYIYRNMIRLR